MKSMAFSDDCYGTGRIRADGRALVAAYLFRVKSPDQSRSPWDVEAPVAMLGPEEAAVPPAETHCTLFSS